MPAHAAVPGTQVRGRALRLHGTNCPQALYSDRLRRLSARRHPTYRDFLERAIFRLAHAYREAVRILAAKGLVEAKPKVGTRVTRRADWHLLDPDVLDWAFDTEPDLVLLDSLFELRDVVDSAAAGLAAKRRSSLVDLQSMRDALSGMAAHTLATEVRQGRP